MSNNTGGPAFPVPMGWDSHGNWVHDGQDSGMTLRDWFAGMAMQGLLAGMLADGAYFERGTDDVTVAKLAYIQADTMLKEREVSK